MSVYIKYGYSTQLAALSGRLFWSVFICHFLSLYKLMILFMLSLPLLHFLLPLLQDSPSGLCKKPAEWEVYLQGLC